jgi:hypothetical protein
MTDLEMTRLCAEAMGFPYPEPVGHPDIGHLVPWTTDWTYDPLHNDSQAMELVKRFGRYRRAGNLVRQLTVP